MLPQWCWSLNPSELSDLWEHQSVTGAECNCWWKQFFLTSFPLHFWCCCCGSGLTEASWRACWTGTSPDSLLRWVCDLLCRQWGRTTCQQLLLAATGEVTVTCDWQCYVESPEAAAPTHWAATHTALHYPESLERGQSKMTGAIRKVRQCLIEDTLSHYSGLAKPESPSHTTEKTEY